MWVIDGSGKVANVGSVHFSPKRKSYFVSQSSPMVPWGGSSQLRRLGLLYQAEQWWQSGLRVGEWGVLWVPNASEPFQVAKVSIVWQKVH